MQDVLRIFMEKEIEYFNEITKETNFNVHYTTEAAAKKAAIPHAL